MARRHMARGQDLKKHTRELAPLKVGDTVSIQNQHGNTPLKCNHTRTIVEVGVFDNYIIKIDGSGQLNSRNRRFFRPASTSTNTNPVPVKKVREGHREEPGSYHRQASLPSVGTKFCQASEGGAKTQVEPPPSSNGTNSQPACNHGQVGRDSSRVQENQAGAWTQAKSP